MNKRKLLLKAYNSAHNLRFSEFVTLIEAFGFVHDRTQGSHLIYMRPDVLDIGDIQSRAGKAKSYQVRQFLALAEFYALKLED